MATRPAWTIKNNTIVKEGFDFIWNGGFALTQKQKNINALHQAIKDRTGELSLDISSKSTVIIGKDLSAFSLKLSGIYLENIFQAAKKYEHGGPYLDLLNVSPKDAKREERHSNSGALVSFIYNNEAWSLEPKTAFYDYIYVNAVIEKYGYDLDISNYQWFTDIEFNPQKSINCQARAVAIYQLIQQEKCYDVIKDKDTWISFHQNFVQG